MSDDHVAIGKYPWYIVLLQVERRLHAASVRWCRAASCAALLRFLYLSFIFTRVVALSIYAFLMAFVWSRWSDESRCSCTWTGDGGV